MKIKIESTIKKESIIVKIHNSRLSLQNTILFILLLFYRKLIY